MSFVHRVRRGDCIASIAAEHGFFVDTVWQHADNAKLRAARESPYVLAEGDEVVVPDRREREQVCATGKRHRFRRRGVPERFRLQLLGLDGPRAGEPYAFEVDGQRRTSQTNGEGWIEEWIPPRSTQARIELGDPVEEIILVALGDLAPPDTEHGARARLEASGHLPRGGGHPELLRAALARFQAEQGLRMTGQLDPDTSEALRRVHGS